MRYVAIGDSFTEGVGDEPTGPDIPRGWADLVAEGLAAAHDGIDYANLAVRGRLLQPIVTDQIDAALALDPLPTMVTLNGGGNDMLRTGDLTALVELTRAAVRRCRDAGIRVVLLAGADPSDRLPFGDTLRHRGEYLTNEIATIAQSEDVEFIDLFHDTEIRRAGYWSADRLHLNSVGHRRAASLILRGLGVPAQSPERPTAGADADGFVGNLRFTTEHLLPWVMRRLRKRSSGDERVAKYPIWISVAPAGIR
ncbi:SGNH/GDSL hydrolase family protein [Gordonia sp. DT30]|uniref:SGNH/GDSL hydrolase family protein n=1 Tax=Gordonia sp. DT30 TaxID=3416546 RepID=UPI003CF8E770